MEGGAVTLAELLLPAERLLQAIDGLAGRLQDTLSVPDPDLPGSGQGADGTDGKKLTVSSPRDPRPAVVPGDSWLHLLEHLHQQKTSLKDVGLHLNIIRTVSR